MRDDSPDGSGTSSEYGWDAAPSGGANSAASLPPRRIQGPPPFAPEPRPPGLALRDYVAIVWRRKWFILLLVVSATASAFYLTSLQADQYSAAASLIYQQQINLGNPLNSSNAYTPSLDRDMAAIADILASRDVQLRIERLLREENVDTSAGYAVTAAPRAESNIVDVIAYSTDPELAAAAANAAATAYMNVNVELQKEQIEMASKVIEGQLETYQGATRQSSEYLMLRQRLQDLQILYGAATGNYRVVAEAWVPGAPYAPNPGRNAMLAFGVSLVAGIIGAFVLEQFDTRLRQADEAVNILHQPILGRIPTVSKRLRQENEIVALTHPEGQVADAFRLLRTNLDFMRAGGDFASLLVTSCAQAEGKSLAVANLAVTVAMAGKKVVVVDADLRRPRQHALFGVANSNGVSTVTAGTSELVQSLVPVEVTPSPGGGASKVRWATVPSDYTTWMRGTNAGSRMYLLPSGPIPPNPGDIVASPRLRAVIQTLVAEVDVVIVDSPAMLAVGDAAALASCVDGLVFLVNMDVARRPMLAQAADQLGRLPCRSLGILLRVQDLGGDGYYLSREY